MTRPKILPLPRAADLMSEQKLQNAVIAYARSAGWRVYHTWISKGSPKGFPDLVMVRGDRIVFAELKTMKGRLRPEQREWLNALAGTRAEVHLWRPSDWLGGTIDAVLGKRRKAA